MKISIEHLTKVYGAAVAVDDLSLEIADGELLVLLGPSGCGKTTTMRAVIGLEEPTAGRIVAGSEVVFDREAAINVPTNKRHMGMVFQSYAIWPHKTVFENVSYPLEQQGVRKETIRERVAATLELVGLEDFAGRGASLLSGGQMQRVALARSIVAEPRVLLLDEPLSNLDAKLRESLRFELREIQQRLKTTTIYVTHDQSEALALADRIAVMRNGKIVQLDTPSVIYKNPVNVFVADFMGVSNILSGRVIGRQNGLTEVRLEPSGLTVFSTAAAEPGAAIHVCIRPEHLVVGDDATAPPSASGFSRLPMSVDVASFLGSHVRYRLGGHDGRISLEAAAMDPDRVFGAGTKVVAAVAHHNAQLLIT